MLPVTLLVSLALAAACHRAPEEPLEPLAPLFAPRPGWMRALVHSEIEPFYAVRFAPTPEARPEIDNLTRLILTELSHLRRVDIGSVSLHGHIEAAREALLRGDAEGVLIYHVRRAPGGRPEAEGLTLTLAAPREPASPEAALFTLHARLEDAVRSGGVDGALDQLQFVIDTNTGPLGALEVTLARVPQSEGAPLWDYTVSRLYTRGPTTREGTVTYRGADTGGVVDAFQRRLWEPLRGEHFAARVAADPTGYLLPGEVVRLPRLERDIPDGTNFPGPHP